MTRGRLTAREQEQAAARLPPSGRATGAPLVELKSSPPRQLDESEVGAFLDRLAVLRPDLALFVVDTALRLGDKMVPMLTQALEARSGGPRHARRVGREIWAVTPRLYAVGAKGTLMGNVCRAVAHGLRSLQPDPTA